MEYYICHEYPVHRNTSCEQIKSIEMHKIHIFILYFNKCRLKKKKKFRV